jgi:hypothetical protein
MVGQTFLHLQHLFDKSAHLLRGGVWQCNGLHGKFDGMAHKTKISMLESWLANGMNGSFARYISTWILGSI